MEEPGPQGEIELSPGGSAGVEVAEKRNMVEFPGTILTLRTIVGRYGESDLGAWWDSEALSPHGQQALRQICPRTAPWRGLELTVLAARRRQAASMRNILAVTLFDFGSSVEAEISRFARFLEEKGADIPASDVMHALTPAQRDLAQALTHLGCEPSSERPSGPTGVDAGRVPVGSIAAGDLERPEVLQHLARALAWAYADLPRGELRTPYVEIQSR